MNDKEEFIARYIRNLRPAIMADGCIDMAETAWLLKTIRPYEDVIGPQWRAFVTLLREVRADGVITSEESARLLKAMDGLLGLS